MCMACARRVHGVCMGMACAPVPPGSAAYEPACAPGAGEGEGEGAGEGERGGEGECESEGELLPRLPLPQARRRL